MPCRTYWHMFDICIGGLQPSASLYMLHPLKENIQIFKYYKHQSVHLYYKSFIKKRIVDINFKFKFKQKLQIN